MPQPLVRLLPKRCLILLAGISFSFSGCAELDGFFPKFKPQKTTEKIAATSSSASVIEKQELLSEENHQLQAKIEQLTKKIGKLQKQQKAQQDDFKLLQEQWEMNFVLLERSVEESLRSSKVSESTALMIAQVLENQSFNKTGNRTKIVSQGSLPPLEDFSLLKKTETDIQKISVTDNVQELEGINNLGFSEKEMRVEEEPGFPETGQVNPQDLEDPEDLPDPKTRALQIAAARSKNTQESGIATKVAKNGFSDPDLNPPEDPFILIRHPGVKKIYNQGMTAIIQKNHNQAILVFENFTERFPEDLDSDNAFYWIGRSHLELNELKKAEEAFRKVLRLYEHRPTSQGYKTPDAIYMLGKLQSLQNLDKRAVYYFEEVVKRFPGSAAARNAERDLGR